MTSFDDNIKRLKLFVNVSARQMAALNAQPQWQTLFYGVRQKRQATSSSGLQNHGLQNHGLQNLGLQNLYVPISLFPLLSLSNLPITKARICVLCLPLSWCHIVLNTNVGRLLLGGGLDNNALVMQWKLNLLTFPCIMGRCFCPIKNQEMIQLKDYKNQEIAPK